MVPGFIIDCALDPSPCCGGELSGEDMPFFVNVGILLNNPIGYFESSLVNTLPSTDPDMEYIEDRTLLSVGRRCRDRVVGSCSGGGVPRGEGDLEGLKVEGDGSAM
jgi:hypothetical protein